LLIQRTVFTQKFFSAPDLVILLLVATTIYGVFAIGQEWSSEFNPITEIDLSFSSLPYYTLLSAIRGTVAYLFSLLFTLVVGYSAAKNRTAEKIIIPLLDILQSIPVLGFLPGLLLALVALFPHTNTGLELAAIIMIFTGQVWNMTFSYYSSLKSVPTDFQEAATVMGLNWYQKLMRVELPYSAVNLAWNSVLSMAGGWFFLIPCEAITLGDKEYRLPGIGAYMDVAVKQGNTQAMILAILAMVLLIVLMDFAIWRPILSWVQRFRLESLDGIVPTEPLMQVWIRESHLVRQIKVFYRDHIAPLKVQFFTFIKPTVRPEVWIQNRAPKVYNVITEIRQKRNSPAFGRALEVLGLVAVALFVGWGAYQLFSILIRIQLSTWFILLRDTLFTLLRVIFALVVSTLWSVPVGIWLGTSIKRIRRAQPIIQALASFPAPMLYPLAVGVFFGLGISFDWISMFLMLLGVQWYVLFNVLAGALRIPKELKDALSLMEAPLSVKWKTLYLPSVFPSLVTGWITAAGGAWNASVLAEYMNYKGTILKTAGLGAALSVATAKEDFMLFAGSLTLMVFVVILLNRLVWSRMYHLVQTRFRMDL
jgi:NitT/TauT family transport system permease protein